MSITKGKGTEGELAFAYEFSKHNIPVLFPFGDNEPYDLVVKLDSFKSVQIKAGSIKDGKIVVPARKRTGAKRLGSQSYKEFGIDYLGVYCKDKTKCSLYLIPFDLIDINYDITL